MNTPLVSVAMVTRNVERFLPEAIESILNQTFRDLEFLIVDFGSTDKTKSIISSYQSKGPPDQIPRDPELHSIGSA